MSLERQIATLVDSTNRLTDEVAGKQRSIDARVDNKISEMESWKQSVQAKDINGETQYKSSIDLTGLSTDKYYPVWWQFTASESHPARLVITRPFWEQGGDSPFGRTGHVASLLLEMEGNSCAWGGDANYLNIKRLSQTYRKTVRNISFSLPSIVRIVDGYPLYEGLQEGQKTTCPAYSGLYLRGGLTYTVYSNFTRALEYSRSNDYVEIFRATSDGYEWIPRKEGGRWLAKALDINDPELGPEYDNYTTAYSYENRQLFAPKA
ncbi:hypothetical protein ACX1HN_21560 [Yersinia pseudotuberculosis]